MAWLQLLSGPGSIGYMHGWWVSRDGKAMIYWGGGNYTHYMCLCGLNRSCWYPCYGNLVPPHLQSQGKAPWGRGWRYGCNCVINDYVWRENRELLTNKTELPVIQLRFGYTGEAGDNERGYHILGKLKCYGINWECCKLYMSDKYQWKTECIKAKNQTSFKSAKKLESMVLRYKIPYLLKLNTVSLLVDERWSSQLKAQLLQLRKESLKKIQVFSGFEPLTSAIPMQRSYQLRQQPTGGRSLNWFVINQWNDDDESYEYMKITYVNAGWRIRWIWSSQFNIDATFAVAKRKPPPQYLNE